MPAPYCGGVTVTDQRTARRRAGDRAELVGARHLAGLGWVVLAANVDVGRDEMDLVALDPGPPACLVFVEVRSNVSGRFGAPEESLAGRKLRRTYRAAFALVRAGCLPAGVALPRWPWRVDVVIVEQGPSLGRGLGGPVVRHLRGVAPD
jgi:Holliday junction resolvase-like predicted endonuclease